MASPVVVAGNVAVGMADLAGGVAVDRPLLGQRPWPTLLRFSLSM